MDYWWGGGGQGCVGPPLKLLGPPPPLPTPMPYYLELCKIADTQKLIDHNRAALLIQIFVHGTLIRENIVVQFVT